MNDILLIGSILGVISAVTFCRSYKNLWGILVVLFFVPVALYIGEKREVDRLEKANQMMYQTLTPSEREKLESVY